MSRGKPVGGLSVCPATAPAEGEAGQDLGEFLPDLGQLECEVTMVCPRLGGVPLGQHGEHAGLPEVPQVVDLGRRPAGDVGVDAESPVEVEARLLDLGIEAGDEKLDARQPLRGCGGLAQIQARAKPAENDATVGGAVHRQELSASLEHRARLPEQNDMLCGDSRHGKIDRRRCEYPWRPGDERAINAIGQLLPVRAKDCEITACSDGNVFICCINSCQLFWCGHCQVPGVPVVSGQ